MDNSNTSIACLTNPTASAKLIFIFEFQARSQSFKDQLAANAATLRSLEAQSHKLKAQNALLNKIMQLQVRPVHVPTIDEVTLYFRI